ncbi:MAG: hypothetical protein A3D35_01695 [Candidatus Staskawiczbacteria bacterium RIFCSPHIGHO2_02_FULL_34_9]|uniref:Uncharacterized protein n=1 Tax=Candidatus Staskawiczbacteria bacterium RIFCSPHIGHO2_02_FULL_34_9 TaxID=1802206 RepID=A0A1G2HXU3_9BACT|nr:MAG: hypothetical protein A3D35_01695 [Candidatus Staskawiczbacteria bacterium RIFCSPHIGHO2_02_FULL_34_9]
MEEKINKNLIRVFNIIFGLSLLFWFIGLIGTIMMFDAPGSTNLWYLWIAFYTYISYPVTVIISIVLSKKFNLTWLSLLPLINIVIFFTIIK